MQIERDEYVQNLDRVRGNWCRTGESLIAEGIDTVLKLADLIRAKGMPLPVFKMVLTGIGSFAYVEKGVMVCPLSALKPWNYHVA